MIRFLTVIIVYCMSVGTYPGKRWFRNFIPETNRSRKSKKGYTPSQGHCGSDRKQEIIRDMFDLWTFHHNFNPNLKLKTFCLNISTSSHDFLAFIVIAAAFSMTVRSFSSYDPYSWYTLLLLASYCFWERLNTENELYYIVCHFRASMLRLLPFRYLSRTWGKICDIRIIPCLRPFVYKFYIKAYGVDMEEALVRELRHYQSMGDFFRRKLNPSFRPINAAAQVVSPVDGTILHNGIVCNSMIEQIKGVSFSLKEFLGPLLSNENSPGEGRMLPLHKYARSLMHFPNRNELFSCVIYLAPGDYHRFHSPAQWSMQHRRHITGDLFSVNPRMVSWIPDLFVHNERVVLRGSWKYGFFSMTAVGATNVGSIVVYEDEDLKTNMTRASLGSYFDRNFEDKIEFSKGSAVGEFKLGSTVVLIYEAPKSSQFCNATDKKIKFGQVLLNI